MKTLHVVLILIALLAVVAIRGFVDLNQTRATYLIQEQRNDIEHSRMQMDFLKAVGSGEIQPPKPSVSPSPSPSSDRS